MGADLQTLLLLGARVLCWRVCWDFTLARKCTEMVISTTDHLLWFVLRLFLLVPSSFTMLVNEPLFCAVQ